MPDFLDKLKQYGAVFGKGLMKEVAPSVASGVIVELFDYLKIDMTKVTKYVQDNLSLLDDLTPEQRSQLPDLQARLGSLDFITPDFIIHSISKDFPALASLFLQSPRARQWLEKQVADLKKEASGSQ